MNKEQIELDTMAMLIATAKSNGRPGVAQWLEQELKELEYRQFVAFIEGNGEPPLARV